MTRLLLVEDDKELAELVTEYLQLNQYSVTACSDGASAIAALAAEHFDLVLLDIMLPGIDGLEVLRKLRRTAATPVIIISARGADTDKIVGLELGADDYLEKPFNHRELLARVKALLRRSQLNQEPQSAQTEGQQLVLGDLYFNLSTRTLFHDEVPVALTGMEYALLLKLAENQGEVVSKEALSKECLGRELTPFDRSIDTHMSKIRKKVTKLSCQVEIRAIRGRGYCLIC